MPLVDAGKRFLVTAFFDEHIPAAQTDLLIEFTGDLLYVIIWSIYIYFDEMHKKIKFVIQARHVKDLTQQKSILNILIPSLVRD